MPDRPLLFPRPPEAPAVPVVVAPLPLGFEIAHLRIERVLSESKHAVVYLARDQDDGPPLALMEYFPRALALRQPDGSVRARHAGDAISLSVARQGFVQDANTLQSVRHPNLMPVLGSLQANRTVYRAMPFIDGVTLERHVRERARAATVGEVTRLLDTLLDALDALHKAGVVHGAVRPDQVLIAPEGQPVLLGMGSAGAELSGHEPGPWSAPEQAAMSRHDRTDSSTDLYLAALTAWFAATGIAPPTLRDRLARPQEWDPAIALAQLPEGEGDSGPTLDNLAIAINAALALLPSDRPQRVADLRALLYPARAHAVFEPSGTTPLWVGVVPDRESQWEVLGAASVRAPAAAPAPVLAKWPLGTAAEGLHGHPVVSTPIGEAQPGFAVPSREPAREPGRGTSPPHAPRWVLPAVLLALVVLALAAWWALRPGDSALPPNLTLPAPAVATPAAEVAPALLAPAPATRDATVPETPRVVPPAVPKPAAAAKPATPAKRSAPATSPQTVCSGRDQFALLYCLQEQCATPAWRNHAQCNDLRRRGDIR